MELGAFSTVLLWSGDGEEEKRGGAASGESEVDPELWNEKLNYSKTN